MTTAWLRFANSLQGKSREGIAAGPLVAADHAAFLCSLPVRQVLSEAESLSRALLDAHRVYQGDFMVVFADVYVEAEAMGCVLSFPEDSTPHVAQPCTPESLRATMPQRDGRLPLMLLAAKRVFAELGSDVPVFVSIKDPFSAAALACGSEEFLALLISDPGRARKAISAALQNQRRYVEAILEIGAHVIIGSPMASGGILGARHFRCFAAEPLAELTEIIRCAGRWAGIHLCGDSEPILDQLSQLPASFLSLESFSAVRWRELVSDGQIHPAIMGYFPTPLLLLGSDEAIRQETRRELETLKGLPHIIATACDVPHKCLPSKVKIFLQAARQPGFS